MHDSAAAATWGENLEFRAIFVSGHLHVFMRAAPTGTRHRRTIPAQELESAHLSHCILTPVGVSIDNSAERRPLVESEALNKAFVGFDGSPRSGEMLRTSQSPMNRPHPTCNIRCEPLDADGTVFPRA